MKLDFPKEVAAAIAARIPLPSFEGELSLDEAYDFQQQVTELRTDGAVGGIKAGVTAKAAQDFFQLEQAVLGRLYADSRLATGCALPFLEGRSIECELAVIADPDGRPKSIAPAIEIVLVQFSKPTDMSAANLVACNLGADLYIVGGVVPWNPSYSELTVQLRRDGDLVNEAEMSEALGGPERATRWMCQEARRRQFDCGDGTLLLTGACGTAVPAEVGSYTADFGRLGKIVFEVVAD